MKNKNLHNAKQKKDDEFYTSYSDIYNELSKYPKGIFRNKIVMLPCDSDNSQFVSFFEDNFENVGLKELLYVTYNKSGQGTITSLVVENGKSIRNTVVLKTSGDFRTQEISSYANKVDFIITNPPFSLFREFVNWLIGLDKSFLVLGNMNAIRYKEIFPLIKNKLMWLGCCNGTKSFLRPDNSYKVLGNTCWYTNVEHNGRNEFIQLNSMATNRILNKKVYSNPRAYKTYDNLNAIEIPSVTAIPNDFDGLMGVPINFLTKHNPAQFEIVDIDRQCDGNLFPNKGMFVGGKELFARIIIKRIH